MTRNMGNLDRALRLGAVLAIAVAYFLGALSGAVAVILGVAAAAFLLTSLIGTCLSAFQHAASTERQRI